MSIVCARLQKKLNPFFSLDGKQDFRHFYLQTATNNLWFQDFLIFKQTTFTMQRKTQTKILKPLVLRKLYGCIFFFFISQSSSSLRQSKALGDFLHINLYKNSTSLYRNKYHGVLKVTKSHPSSQASCVNTRTSCRYFVRHQTS